MNQIKASNISFFLRIANGRMIVLSAISLAMTFLIVACNKNEKEGITVKESYQTELEELMTRYEKGDTVALYSLVRMMQDCPDRNTCKDMAKNVYKIANQYTSGEFFNLAIDLYKAGKLAAEKSEDKEIRLTYYVELACNYQRIANEDSLKHYMQLIGQFPPEYFNPISKTQFLLTKAFIAKGNNNYLEAIDYYLRALALVKGQQSVNEGTILENLGELYLNLKYYNRSLSYLNISLPIYEKERDTFRLIRIYGNLGVVYMHLDSLPLAARMQSQSIALAKKNSIAHARGLANFGNVLLRMGKHGEARNAFDSSTAICERLGIPYGIFINKINLSHALLDTRNTADALRILKEVQNSPFLTDKHVQLEVYENFLKAYEQLYDFQRAYDYQKKIIDLNNTMSESGEERLALEWEERFLRQIKDQELAEVSNQLNVSRQQQKLGLLAGIFALCTLLFIIRLFYLRKQKLQLRSKLLEEEGENLRLQLELRERALTSQAIHLQSIGGFTEDISSKLTLLRNKLKGDSADELTRIIKDFENGIPEELWDDFRLRFEKVNEEFHQNLLSLAPDLTPVEIKIASFLRLNLSSKEISRLTNRSAGTISNTRSSLRKKLNLEEEDNLTAFLISL